MTEKKKLWGVPIAVCVLQVGGCGGCYLEAQAALRVSRYHALRRGIVFVETPSHADVLLLCGAGPSSLVAELHQIAESLYEPWICLRLGDCGVETEAVFPGREIALPGCAPEPEEILNALEAVRHGRDRSQAATVLVSGEEGGG